MYVWNSCEILQVLLTYFISLIITEHIRFMKNLQLKKKSDMKSEKHSEKFLIFFFKNVKKGKKVNFKDEKPYYLEI